MSESRLGVKQTAAVSRNRSLINVAVQVRPLSFTLLGSSFRMCSFHGDGKKVERSGKNKKEERNSKEIADSYCRSFGSCYRRGSPETDRTGDERTVRSRFDSSSGSGTCNRSFCSSCPGRRLGTKATKLQKATIWIPSSGQSETKVRGANWLKSVRILH